ncbi:MAG: IS66 family transposase, partial [Solirubrobacteraceae bacterium]
HLHVDATRWRHLWVKRGENGWLWVFVGVDTTVYRIADSRAHEVVLHYLGLQEGEPAGRVVTLVCDFMKAYDALHNQVERARCWVHYRRLILECRTRCPRDPAMIRWVDQWMEMVDDFFHFWYERRNAAPGSPEWEDADLTLRGCAEEMEFVRTQQLGRPDLPPDARRVLDLGDAHWPELTRCVEDPAIPPDNNPAERALRTPVNERKNFYGSGAPWAARFAAQMWTVLMTVRQNGLNPLALLIAYLTACAEAGGQAPDDLERFFPWALCDEDRAALSQPPEVGYG